MSRQIHWQDDNEIVEAVARNGAVTAAAVELGVNYEALRARIRARNLGPAIQEARAPQHARMAEAKAVKPPEDRPKPREVTSDDPAEWGDIERLLRLRGLNPEEWVVVRVRVNEWGEDGEPNQQLRVDLEPVSKNSLLPARSDGWTPPKEVPARPERDGELVAFFGDQHCPHHDEELHAATCEWLRKNRPDRAVLIGDLLDFDAVSRHRFNPEWANTMQESIDSAYDILRGYVEASPGTMAASLRQPRGTPEEYHHSTTS